MTPWIFLKIDSVHQKHPPAKIAFSVFMGVAPSSAKLKMAKFKTAATIIRVFIMNRIRSSYLNNLFSRLQIFTTWLMSFAMFKPDMLFMDRVTPRDSKGSLVLRGMIGVN